MNKTDLTKRIARANGLDERHAGEIVSLVFDALAEALASGERVSIRGFGGFEVRLHGEKVGRNPQTGERLVLPPRNTVVFTSSRSLRKLL
jgi:nucleoid DNA-binding protein